MLAATAAGYLALLGLGIFGEFSEQSTWLQALSLAAVVVTALAAIAAPIANHRKTRAIEKEQERTKNAKQHVALLEEIYEAQTAIRAALRPLFLKVGREGSVDPLEWSVVAYLVTDQDQALERIERLSMRPRSTSAIQFRAGKGVVGKALETGRLAHVNFDKAAIKAAIEHPDPSKWDALPDSERMDLTQYEAATVNKYTTIYAAPVFERIESSTVVGIISITGPKGTFAYIKQNEEDLATYISNTARPFNTIRKARDTQSQLPVE